MVRCITLADSAFTDKVLFLFDNENFIPTTLNVMKQGEIEAR